MAQPRQVSKVTGKSPAEIEDTAAETANAGKADAEKANKEKPEKGKEEQEEEGGGFNRVKSLLAGIITGGADNDPSAITTYSVAGANTGYSQLWLMVLATPMLIAVQSTCARIGDVTHKGLGQVIREHFPRPLAYLMIAALILTTILMIGADLIGIGTAFSLIIGIKFIMWIVPVATAIWLLVLFTRFETFTRYLGVVVIIFLGYIVSAIFAHPNWGQVAQNIVLPPIQLKYTYLSTAVGILGATFTPPLFFWQTKEEVEEDGNTMKRAGKQNKLMAPGFIFGQVVTLFIMIATAATLYQHHQQIKTAADAARALEPFAGPAAKILFAVGLIGSGLMAIPVLASAAGYMVAEVLGWKQSLSEQVDAAKGFYIVITLALFLGVEIAISGLDPIQVMFFSQMLAGIIGPFILVMVLILANNKRIMGEHTNKLFDNAFSILAVLVLAASTILMLIQSLTGKG